MLQIDTKLITCVIWVPCITHDFFTSSITDTRSFRISDLFLSEDKDGKKYELWGKVYLSSNNLSNLNENDFTRYNITLEICKNTNKKCIGEIVKLNTLNKALSKYPYFNLLFGRYYNRLIDKINKMDIVDRDLTVVQTLELKCVFASHNGMLCFSYDIPEDIPECYNIFSNGELPPCIYHNIKELFHIHEFHDNESDSVLTPFYPEEGKKWNLDDILLMAVEHNLKEFQEKFRNRMLELKFHYQMKNDVLRKSAYVKIPVFVAIALVFGYIIDISDSIGWFQYISTAVSIILILISFDAIIYWKDKYSTFFPKESLRIKGEHSYVLSLKRSKYIKDNDNCRRLVHNINNLTNVAIHYIDAIICRGNNTMAIISILLAVFIFLTQLLLTLAIDFNTTNAIKSAYDAIESLKWHICL